MLCDCDVFPTFDPLEKFEEVYFGFEGFNRGSHSLKVEIFELVVNLINCCRRGYLASIYLTSDVGIQGAEKLILSHPEYLWGGSDPTGFHSHAA